MKKRIMAVFDVEPCYADRLAEAANQREKVPFTVIAFTNMDKLTEFSMENQVEILLVDEKSRQAASQVRANQVVILSEGEALGCEGHAV